MASITTMLLSTSIPMPTASPPSETIFSVMPISDRHISAASTESGIVIAMTSEVRTVFKNRNIIRIASAPPISILISTLETLSEMNCDWSSRSLMFAVYPCAYSLFTA